MATIETITRTITETTTTTTMNTTTTSGWRTRPLTQLAMAGALALTAAFAFGCPPPNGGEGEGEGGVGEGEGEGEGEGAACGNDPLLGGLTLASGFITVAAEGLPDDVIGLGISDLADGSPNKLVGLTNDLHAVDLGTFPGTTPALPAALFDLVAPADAQLDRTSAVFPSFLVVDRALVAGGYTRAIDFGGSLAGFSIAAGGSPQYIDAPLNFAAATRGDVILVNGGGLGAAQSGKAVYASSAASGESTVATLGASAGIFNGPVVATPSGVVVVGRFNGGNNELFALSSARVDAVLAGGAPIDLDGETAFFTGSLNGFASGVSSFGEGVALINPDASFAGASVSFIALTDAGNAVTAAAPIDVVTGGSFACTNVTFLATIAGNAGGQDLLVGEHDANGNRVVQLRQQ